MSNLNEKIKQSKEIATKVQSVLEGKETGKSTKDLIIAAFLSLTCEHHIAIVTLIEKGIPSSAAALARPILEATYRGTWLVIVANEKDAKKINKPNYKWNSLWNLSKEIDKVIGTVTIDGKQMKTFYSILKRNLISLHGYTHGGLQQLSRQFNKNKVQPTFTDEELYELLLSSDGHLGMMLLAFGDNVNDQDIIDVGKGIVTK